jgi:hypothetical protein
MVFVMNKLNFLILTLLMISVRGLFSQSIDIERIVTDNYPNLRAEFRVLDASDDEVRNLNANDFDLTDLGVATQFTAPTCPPDQSRFSLILIFDASSSMDKNISDESNSAPSRHQVIKNVAKTFIDQLPDGQFEAAVGVFSKDFRYDQLQRFTTDKDLLKQATDYNLVNATNYNAGFLGYRENNEGGAFGLVKDAQYKPVIIFMTDGYHQSNQQHGDIEVGIINQKASETNTTIYSLTIGPTQPDPNDFSLDQNSKAKLKSISVASGGEYFENLLSESDVQSIYSQILRDAEGFGTPAPCYIDFVSDCNDGEIMLTYNGFGLPVSDTEAYTIADELKPNLDIDERTFLEVNLPLNQATEIDVVIKAEKNFLEITGFNSTPANIFTISDWGGAAPPFSLAKDETRTIKVEINPDNREFFGGNITFEGTGCSGLTMTPRAGFIFAEDILFGSVNQGEQKTETFTQRFCNLTDEPLDIERIIMTGGTNQGDFAVTSQNTTVAPGECIDIEALFAPSEQGEREGEYTVITDKGDFTAMMKGGGAGRPEISGVAPEFADVNCISPTSTITVDVTNNGPVDLNISNIQLADDTHFNITGSTLFTVGANSTNSSDLVVEFNPQAVGTHTTDLIITNDSDNSPYNITISGEMIEIDYSVSTVNIDFGTICANEGNPITEQIELTNLNSFGYSVSASANLPVFDTDAISYDISSGTATVDITFESANNGTYVGFVTFVSECGNIERIINVMGEINSPEVIDVSEVIPSVVGSSEIKTVTITNPNPEDFDVVNAFIGDAAQTPLTEFSLSNTSFTVPGNGTYNLDVRYTPDANNAVELDGFLYLNVEQPCDVTLNNVLIKGVPDLAVANLTAANTSDYIGATTMLNIDVTGSPEFNASGSTKIEFTLQYDENMLNPLTGTKSGTNEVSYVIDLPTPFPGALSFAPEFEVLNSLPVTQSDLVLLSSRAINDNNQVTASVVNTDGIFSIIIAEADVSSNDLSAKPGEEFDLPIYLDDEDSDLDELLHNEITLTVQYNFTVMQPVDLPFTVVGQDRAEFELTSAINYTNETKLGTTQAQLPFATVRMLAKLGNTIQSPIEITAADITSGGIADLTLDTKTFTLEGVCEEGGSLRLFTLTEIEPSITLNQNPVSNKIELTVSTIESGEHKITLFDMVGNAIELDSRSINTSGQSYSIEYETANLQSGMYIVIFDTPTQSFNESIMIVK